MTNNSDHREVNAWGSLFRAFQRPINLGNVSNMMNWTESLSVNEKKLDGQHKALFILVNDLLSMRGSTVDPEELTKKVEVLQKILKTHFQDEEEYLSKCNYPHLEEHAREHRRLIEKFESLKSNLKERNGWGVKRDYSWPVLQFMLELTTGHIMKSDMDYRDTIAQ